MKVKVAGAFVLVSVLIAAWLPTHGGGPTLGNLFVDHNGGSCGRSATLVEYADAAACPTLAAAYAAASPGDIVRIRSGSYGAQTIPTSSNSAPPVVFGESDGEVSLNSLTVNGDQVTFQDITVTGGVSIVGPVGTGKAIGVRFDRSSIHGIYLQNTSNVTVAGTCSGAGPYGGCTSEICCTFASEAAGSKAVNMAGTDGSGDSSRNTDFTITGTAVHDQTRENAAVHTECVFALSTLRMTIRNSRFYNCAVYDISLARLGGDPDPEDTLIENNVFERSDNVTPGGKEGFFSIVLAHVSARYGNLVFRNNTFEAPVQFAGPDGEDTAADAYDQTSFISNIMKFPGGATCAGSGSTTDPTYEYNVIDRTGGKCGATDLAVGDVLDSFVDPGGHNFQLRADSPAIGAGSPDDSTSADNRARARDAHPDAGAFEYGAAAS